jgi:hypothetical protein
MKSFKRFAGIAGLMLLAFVLPAQQSQPRDPTQQPPPPWSFPTPPPRVEALWKSDDGTRTVTFKILPGQALRVYNPYFDFVKIQTRFPVSVHMSPSCSSERTTEFDCRDVPPDAYIVVYDSRVGVSPDYSPANPIKFICVHH